MVSDCRTRRYHPAVLVGGARMCACCMHTCSLARVRGVPLSPVSPYSPTVPNGYQGWWCITKCCSQKIRYTLPHSYQTQPPIVNPDRFLSLSGVSKTSKNKVWMIFYFFCFCPPRSDHWNNF
ncbi:unnamed protein product [Acanthoscelides obtectus]|uniref:Uncharacterized protein n=3 Tax=Acanthoscelides obtectus TaxID=200917 RepID=A0A9P0K587_ACAOB|nr:unnamed protein product [Acanthoscelides obtectus]CAK1646688.1 hypothetical protein AOBTE_LOCUS14817 [Acanthoscelides obtectus]